MEMPSSIQEVKSEYPLKTTIEDTKATVSYDKDTPVHDKGKNDT